MIAPLLLAALAAAPTLAILGDSDGGALAELSKHPAVVLVEREQISSLALERALAEARDGTLHPWPIAAADGLLLIEPTGDGFQARLFSTHNGLCVWQTSGRTGGASPWPLIAEEVVRAATKLRLTPQEVVPVGLLGLWPATAHPESAERTRHLTRAVELRLADSPGVVLLERRRLGDATFERALRENNPELARSARLLEGSFDVINHRWEADVLVRGLDGTKNAVVRLEAESLDGLARKIVAQVKGSPSRDSVGSTEAAAFVQEAKRAERAGLDELALDLAETALALGAENPELLALLARLHARMAGCEDPYDVDQTWMDASPEERLALGQRRAEHAHLALNYLERTGGKGRQLVLNACSGLLRQLDRDAPDAADREALRARLRKLAPFDPTGKQAPYHLAYAADFAPTWANSPEEVIAFHRSWLHSTHKHKLWTIKRLSGDPHITLGERFPDPDHKRRLLREFAAELQKEPGLALVGLSLDARIKDPQICPAAMRRYFDAFIEQAEELEASGQFESIYDAEYGAGSEFHHEHARRLVAILPRLQKLHEEFLYKELYYREYDPAEARQIRQAFEDYRKRILATLPTAQREEAARRLAHNRRLFIQRNPAAITIEPSDERLLVHRYWPVPPTDGDGSRFIVSVLPVADGVWLSTSQRETKTSTFWHLALPELQARSIPVANRIAPVHFGVSDALYGIYHATSEIARIELASGAVEARPSRQVYGLWACGNQLAFSLWDSSGRDDENGLLVWDWATREEKIVGSSKRIPPRTAYDGIANSMIEVVAKLPDGRLLVVQGHPGRKVVAVDPTSGAYEVLLEGPQFWAFPLSDGILLADHLGEVWHFDGHELTCWMNREGTAHWTVPADWNASALGHKQITAANGRLYFLQVDGDGALVLRVFAPDAPAEGYSIPLRFHNAAAPNLETTAFQPHLFATRSGLVFNQHFDGVWFLPFADLPTP